MTKAKKWIRGAVLLLAGAAAALGIGLALGAVPLVGCRENDLTPVPDTGFLASESSGTAAPSEAAPEAAPESAPPAGIPEKWVCLTFDDGPSKTTPAVLKALKDAGIHATFFVVATGYNDSSLPLITEAAAAGHQIALHSASHEYSDIYRSAAAYWQDIALLKSRIAPYVTAEELHYLRFPGGSTNTVSRRYGGKGLMKQLKREVREKGYQWVDWNVCAEDAVGTKPSADEIFRNIVRETGDKRHCIVLMHDSSSTQTTAEALPDIIAWYRDRDYVFCRVDEVVPLAEEG